MSDRNTGCSPLNAENNQGVTYDVIFAYAHEKINILLSVLNIFISVFYEFNLKTQGFVSHHRNVQVFAKCNVCISAIQLFYIQRCPGFLPTSK